ncbi:MAG: hypothetical protein ACYSVY_26070 [Planctomycetota bacterium]|jgi:hypothetical protein
MGESLLKLAATLSGLLYEVIRAVDDDDPQRVQDILPGAFQTDLEKRRAELRAARKFRSQR